MSAVSEEDEFQDPAGGTTEGGEAGAAASPAPEPQGQAASAPPWWEAVCARIARGSMVTAGERASRVEQYRWKEHGIEQ